MTYLATKPVELSASEADLIRKLERVTGEQGMGGIGLLAEMFWCALEPPEPWGQPATLQLDDDFLEGMGLVVNLVEEAGSCDEHEVAEMRLLTARLRKQL